MSLPLPFNMRDTEPLQLKLGPPIDCAAEFEKLFKQQLEEQRKEDEQRPYDEWFKVTPTMPPFLSGQDVWVWIRCSSAVPGKTRVNNGENEFPCAARIGSIDSFKKTCNITVVCYGDVTSHLLLEDVPWDCILTQEPQEPYDLNIPPAWAAFTNKPPEEGRVKKKLKGLVRKEVKEVWKCGDCSGTRLTCTCDDDE